MDAKQVEKFKGVMLYVQETTHVDAFKDVAFMALLLTNGLKETEVFTKSIKEMVEFSEYLESVGIGSASVHAADYHPFGFMFLDDAKEIGATITKE